ncbi:hypothetical protein ACIBJI_40070 [Nocardia sp. NPDC050408]|uniref:hypothetical protein n=1 Tax=Nocardia sp. NPDC050408 TaxID=3364319 RepID=UPI0037B63CB0
MSDTAADDEHAILEQTRAAQVAHAAGDHDTAYALHADLVTRYELTAIADVMYQRDVRERLGIEVELLRTFGPTALYGRADPSS